MTNETNTTNALNQVPVSTATATALVATFSEAAASVAKAKGNKAKAKGNKAKSHRINRRSWTRPPRRRATRSTPCARRSASPSSSWPTSWA